MFPGRSGRRPRDPAAPVKGDPMYPQSNCTAAQEVTPSPNLPELEREVAAFWAQDKTFAASVAARPAGEAGENEYVFYDGPPFANGLPHYGHLLTGYVKDVVPRYQTMRGRRVERTFGWDCHGLPAEVEAEKQLGITSKAEIDKLGIEKFNDTCRTSVLAYTKEWQEYIHRQARWVDFENGYKTLDPDYMESVMWAFKNLWNKGLIYEGFRVLAYCWRCETPLSNTETRMDDVYRQRQDPALTVGLQLDSGEYALVWTTTPWTLPSNLAAAVNASVDYAIVTGPESGPFAGERLVLAAARIGHYQRELGLTDLADAKAQGRLVEVISGSDLVGRKYTPVFDFFSGRPQAHQIIAADFVTTENGTGIVHLAPAFGEDDKIATDAVGIEPVVPVNNQGEFTVEVPPYAGMQVFEANKPIIADLKAAGLVLRQETYDHPYPHCWRCDNPLIYRAVSSWFVKVTQFRDRMVELNQQITWVPEHVKDGSFGNWLANARDWSISRSRYWGSPIPVWVSDDPTYPRVDVYGSIAELEADFGVRPQDLHRPFIDQLTRANPDDPTGKSVMRRVPEVLDCWFESGAMPFAQVHYPFENKEWFDQHYPGDFIVEYIGQTRGWFYTMHVLATALFDRPAFKTCVSHGILLGDDGRKMSKSLKNYPDVREVFERDGADAMRWCLMSSPVLRGGNLVVTERAIRDGVRQSLMPLWNSWYFFALYANSCGDAGYPARWSTDSTDVLDQYLLAKLGCLVAELEQEFDAYDLSSACQLIRDFLDVLTNWYIRRSRERFWTNDQTIAGPAFNTLYTTLEVLTRVCAPLLPLITEAIWQGLTGGRSVHLTDWPKASELPANAELVSAMDQVRQVCSAGSALRKAHGLRVRLPLKTLTVVGSAAAQLQPFSSLIADELNVAQVQLLDVAAAEAAGFTVTQQLTVLARVAGPRLGGQVQAAIKGSKSGQWQLRDGVLTSGGCVLQEGEYTLETVVGGGGQSQAVGLLPGGFVLLDTEVTPEQAAVGLARDLIREIQEARRAAGLAVSDRINLSLGLLPQVLAAAQTHADLIQHETLAQSLVLESAAEQKITLARV